MYSVKDSRNPSFSEPNILTPIAPRSHKLDQEAFTDSSLNTSGAQNCYTVSHDEVIDNIFVLAIKLAEYSHIGAIILVSDVTMNQIDRRVLFSDFRIYIGESEDSYASQTASECQGGPFL